MTEQPSLPGIPESPADPRYAALRAILDAAYDQAATGKGAERHGNGLPFKRGAHVITEPDPRCSFCGKPKSKVEKMVSTETHHICGDCIKSCAALKETKAST